MAHFEIGKQVICLQSFDCRLTDGSIGNKVKKGDIFTLQAMKQGPCNHHKLLLDIGLNVSRHNKTICEECRAEINNHGIEWVNSDLFAPIDEIEISETTYEDVMQQIESKELQIK